MRCLFVAALVTCLTGEVGQALAYTCNNNYYVNSSGAPCSLAVLRPGTREAHGGMPRWQR